MKSYWIEENKEKENYKTLKKDIETDICIIGGGITGLSIAYYLNQYKIKNVILEKDEIGNRATGGSTAKITSQHGLFYKYLIDSEGEEFAKNITRQMKRQFQILKKLLKMKILSVSLKENHHMYLHKV